MKRKSLILVIIFFLLGSALSDTILCIALDKNTEIIDFDFDSEKNETEQEIEEVKNAQSIEYYLFTKLDCAKSSFIEQYNILYYKNPYFKQITPPPKFI